MSQGPGRGQSSFTKILLDSESSFREENDLTNKPYKVDKLITTAVDVDPSRVAYAEPAGVLDPSRVLKGQKRADFLDHERRVLKELEEDSRMPKPCIMLKEDEERSLRLKLLILPAKIDC